MMLDYCQCLVQGMEPSKSVKAFRIFACGMVVCGIDHAGHQIESSGDWLQLYTQKTSSQARFHGLNL